MRKRNRQLTDEELVSRYQETKSAESFELLYERYAHKVFQKCLSMTSDTEEARDYTQDIFIKVLGKLKSFRHRSAFATWLYSISYNYCADRIKQSRRILVEPMAARLDNQPDDEPSDEADNRYYRMMALLQQVSEPEVTLLKLKYEQGLLIREIAQRLHMNESAVKMRLKRSRERLKRWYNSQP